MKIDYSDTFVMIMVFLVLVVIIVVAAIIAIVVVSDGFHIYILNGLHLIKFLKINFFWCQFL